MSDQERCEHKWVERSNRPTIACCRCGRSIPDTIRFALDPLYIKAGAQDAERYANEKSVT